MSPFEYTRALRRSYPPECGTVKPSNLTVVGKGRSIARIQDLPHPDRTQLAEKHLTGCAPGHRRDRDPGQVDPDLLAVLDLCLFHPLPEFKALGLGRDARFHKLTPLQL